MDAVIFASVLPSESTTSSPASTFTFDPKKIKAAAKNAAPSSIDASTPTGFISQIDLAGGEAFGVKVAPFAFRDCSVPVQCLSSLMAEDEFFCAERGEACLVAYHPLQSALFCYAGGKEKPVSRSFGHERICALAVSPCASFVLAGTESGSLVVWRLEGGEVVAVVEGAHFQAVRVIRFAPDGVSVVTGGADALVKVWSFSPSAGLSLVYTFSGHSEAVTDVCVSACAVAGAGRVASVSLDGKVRLMDLVDGQCLLEVDLSVGLSAVVMDAAETQLFCASVEGAIHVIDFGVSSSERGAATPALMKGHRGVISALAWSPDERVLISAGFEDGLVVFWDSQSRQLLKSLSLGQKCGVSGLVVKPRADVSVAMIPGATGARNTMVPFKRVGSAVVSLAESVPLKAAKESVVGAVDGAEMGEVKRENAQLRQINAELVALLE